MDYTAFLTPSLGIGGIVLFAVIMILRGDLISRKQSDMLLSVKDTQIAFLEKANEDLRAALAARDSQMAEMMVTARTTRRVLDALPEATGLSEGGPHVPAEEG